MLRLSCQVRMMGAFLRISPHSIPSRVCCSERVFKRSISFNGRYHFRAILSKGAIPKKSADWEPPELQKLYEDDWVLAISKPGSLLVHNSKEASREEKDRKAFLKDLVEAQHTQGRYLVLARGSTPDSFICDEPVNDDKGIPRSAWTKCDKLLDLPKSRCSLLKVIGDGRHGKGQTNQYFRDNYQMPLGRCFLHAARLTIPHPSIFSAQCINRKLPTGDLESPQMMESGIHSEHIESDVSTFMNIESNSSIPLIPEIVGLQIDCLPGVLSLRASLPTDLRRVLLALPDGLSCEFVDSFNVII